MMDSQPLDMLPIWSVYFLTVILLYLATETGFRFGKLVQKHWPDGAEIGVGGGISTVVPGKGGLGTFSPRLDGAGNSVRGQLATEFLSTRLGFNIFASQTDSGISLTTRSNEPTGK